jgi:hypothetical protein
VWKEADMRTRIDMERGRHQGKVGSPATEKVGTSKERRRGEKERGL